MNVNTINFNSFQIEIPKISKEQYFLLRLLLKAVEERQIKQNSYFISIDLFQKTSKKKLQNLLQNNIEIIVKNKASGNWCWFSVMNNIEITKDKIYFTPATVIKEIILESHTSSKKAFLKYILFNGIRHKQTLLLLDYILKLNKSFFEISIKDLRIVFELQLDQYKNFNSLKNFVIERAVKEINEKTSLNIEYEITKKEGRKVIAVSFTYYSKEIQ
jgi:plasmid replication initiation protein